MCESHQYQGKSDKIGNTFVKYYRSYEAEFNGLVSDHPQSSESRHTHLMSDSRPMLEMLLVMFS
jgi:hypothetical protein